ncbi:DNA polymerase III subunit delta' [Pseudoalteromonas phenolica]|nr:DNA polymerase III subunit delta' [Pseudoalteromonas phenolica]
MMPWLERPWQQLNTSFKAGRFHHAQLLAGLQGVGKLALAQGLADAILCENTSELLACGQCKSCALIAAQTHPDKLLVSSEGATIGVDEIRAIADFIYHSAQQGGNKVVIVHQAHKMTHSAANALLKTLEEPNAKRFLILTCDDVAQLPATIVSRCAKSNVAVQSQQQVRAWLIQQLGDYVDQPWIDLFVSQPLKIKHWIETSQVEQINQLFNSIERLGHDTDVSECVELLMKSPELVSEMSLFVQERIKQRLCEGADFF